MDNLRNKLGIAALSLLLGSAWSWAQPLAHQSDWMELVKGYKGKQLGAELRDIQAEDAFGRQAITIAIPKSAIAHPDTMEEVRVIGRRPEAIEFEFPLEFSYEWVADYDNDYYGLVLHLGKDARIPFRLYMESRTGFTN
ncbi:hypothetical protein H2508_01815 [Parahaliea sp. F7430]|uniref:DUF4426 domain-containing protein n=1 Tax=Sediminihaliea albiluteola TaxID=2758564 RepID=A0A7W2YIA0_9GAMM|nr:hypothetical protein [Sediminihaliea albiluteola]MBA6411845.1 hypothetical protein [Sediminihaliea albiluteola]